MISFYAASLPHILRSEDILFFTIFLSFPVLETSPTLYFCLSLSLHIHKAHIYLVNKSHQVWKSLANAWPPFHPHHWCYIESTSFLTVKSTEANISLF